MDALAARLDDEPELTHAYTEALERYLAARRRRLRRARRRRARRRRAGPARRPRARDRSPAARRRAPRSRRSCSPASTSFLLDEPTNNLDFAGLDRLERFLDGLDAGVVLVSHDRAFLDRTITRVVEIEAETRSVHEYAGTWSDYEAARERARDAARSGLRRLRRRARPLHDAALHPPFRGARGRRDGGSPRHERAAREGRAGEAPSRAARRGRQAVEPVAAAAPVRRAAADRVHRRARRRARRGRLVRRSARSTCCSATATGSRSSARTAPARRR